MRKKIDEFPSRLLILILSHWVSTDFSTGEKTEPAGLFDVDFVGYPNGSSSISSGSTGVGLEWFDVIQLTSIRVDLSRDMQQVSMSKVGENLPPSLSESLSEIWMRAG